METRDGGGTEYELGQRVRNRSTVGPWEENRRDSEGRVSKKRGTQKRTKDPPSRNPSSYGIPTDLKGETKKGHQYEEPHWENFFFMGNRFMDTHDN